MSYNYLAPPESYFPTTMEENDDLRWAIDNAPHTVTFWNAVCAYINHEREHGEDPDRVLECPSWGQWRSIGQHFAAGKKVEAIKLLRASTCVWTGIPPSLPPYIANEGVEGIHGSQRAPLVGSPWRPQPLRGQEHHRHLGDCPVLVRPGHEPALGFSAACHVCRACAWGTCPRGAQEPGRIAAGEDRHHA